MARAPPPSSLPSFLPPFLPSSLGGERREGGGGGGGGDCKMSTQNGFRKVKKFIKLLFLPCNALSI